MLREAGKLAKAYSRRASQDKDSKNGIILRKKKIGPAKTAAIHCNAIIA